MEYTTFIKCRVLCTQSMMFAWAERIIIPNPKLLLLSSGKFSCFSPWPLCCVYRPLCSSMLSIDSLVLCKWKFMLDNCDAKPKRTKRYNVNDNFGNTEQTLFVFAVQCLEAMICAFYVRVNWAQHAHKRYGLASNNTQLFCITILRT